MIENSENVIPQNEPLPPLRPQSEQAVVSFEEISGGTSEVVIEHMGQRYVLRATRNGRLLLNK